MLDDDRYANAKHFFMTDCTSAKHNQLSQRGIECTPAWTGGCYNGRYLKIMVKMSRVYTMDECYTFCQMDKQCDSFSIGYGGMKRCVTYFSGCTVLRDPKYRKAKHFFMDDCRDTISNDAVQCTIAWNGGCYNGRDLNIRRKADKIYTFRECYAICEKDIEQSFESGVCHIP